MADRMRRGLSVLIAVALLAGCGFRLAGTGGLPEGLQTVDLSGNLDDDQFEALSARLTQAGASVVESGSDGAVRLQVQLITVADRNLVASASTGRTVVRLTRALNYSLRDADNALLLGPTKLTQQRDLQLDDDNLLASTEERRNAVVDLELALYNRLIRQLRSLE